MRYAATRGQGLQNTLNAIKNRIGFNAGNLWAQEASYLGGGGHLPAGWMKDIREVYERVTYVVYSYYTPIAWYVEGEGWVVPEVRYSNSTGRHQSTVRSALYGLGPEGRRITTLASIRRAKEIFA